MAKRPLRLTNLPVATLGIVAIGVGAAAMTLGSSDTVVERGFERALASRAEQPNTMKIAAPAVAGSEQFWLTHVVHDASAPFTKPVAVGDRVPVGGAVAGLHAAMRSDAPNAAHMSFGVIAQSRQTRTNQDRGPRPSTSIRGLLLAKFSSL